MRQMWTTPAAALAAAGALLAASPAQADDRRCDGLIGPETVPGGVVVPDGEVCELAGTRVIGSVRVGTGAALFAQGIALSGNLDVRADADVSLDQGEIAGNVKAVGNRGFTEIGDNDVGGNLTCFANDPAPVGGGNRVEGNREGQCAAL